MSSNDMESTFLIATEDCIGYKSIPNIGMFYYNAKDIYQRKRCCPLVNFILILQNRRIGNKKETPP
jgi:hypothetical protein